MCDDIRHAILVSKSDDGINRDLKRQNAVDSAVPECEMPTLFRFLLVIGVLGGLMYAGAFWLSRFVDPQPREMTVTIPPDKLFKPPR
jgi:hypothetical protein